MKTDAVLLEVGAMTSEEKKSEYIRSVMAPMEDIKENIFSFGGAADPATSR